MSRFLAIVVALLAAIACSTIAPTVANACTRCVYLGPDGMIIVARSMDWAEDPGTNLYCFPRGMKRDGAAGPRSINWTSKFGSVGCAFYEAGTVDGMNERGLVANVLYLVESDYGKPDGRKPTLSITAWGQYALDNFATVAEAVETLGKEPFVIIAPILPNGAPAQGHLSLSDPTGDSAIFEYIGGRLHIHHGRQYQVMTNSPAFDQQLALNTYWEQIGGLVMLPGTSRAADRFARAFVLHQGDSADGRAEEGHCVGFRRDTRRVGAAGHHHPGPAEHRQHGLADVVRPEEQGLLFRLGDQPDDFLDAPGRLRLQRGRGGEEAHAHGRQDL